MPERMQQKGTFQCRLMTHGSRDDSTTLSERLVHREARSEAPKHLLWESERRAGISLQGKARTRYDEGGGGSSGCPEPSGYG